MKTQMKKLYNKKFWWVGNYQKIISSNFMRITEEYINNIQEYIGKSSTEGDRKRIYRHRINEDKNQLGHLTENCPDINPPELELKLDLKLKKELKLKNKQKQFKNLLEFKKFCIEKYKNKILTNCCPSLLLVNQLKINSNGYLESYFDRK